MKIEFADRVKRLPPYLFAEIEKVIKEKKAQGVDLISLSIGDPDLPPPPFIIASLKEEVANLKNHNYSFSQGEPDFRQAVAEWYKKRFHVDLSQEQVVALLGSKEGIANIGRAFVNAGDRVLVPDPAYPVYANGTTILNEAVPVSMPLLEENRFLPDFGSVNPERVKMMFLNYPNNPTSATADKKFLREAVDFASYNNIILCYESDEQPDFLKKMNEVYSERRDLLVKTLCEMGFECEKPKATFYVWTNCKSNSMEFATKLLDVGVAVTPGIGFGIYGENYVRFSLTQPKDRIMEACDRITDL